MRFLDYIKMAFLNLRRQKLRTFLTIISVVIGAVAVLSLVSLGSTVKTVFMQEMNSMGALTEIVVSKQGEGGGSDAGPFTESDAEQIRNKDTKIDDAVIKKIRKIDGIKSATPVISVWDVQGMKLVSEKKTYAARAEGISKDQKINLMVGSTFKKNDEHSIIIGNPMVKALKFKDVNDALGQEVELVTRPDYRGEGSAITLDYTMKQMRKSKTLDMSQIKKRSHLKAKIIGVLPPGPKAENNYVPIGWARKMRVRTEYNFDFDSSKVMVTRWDNIDEEGYDGISVEAQNPGSVKKIANKIKKDFGFSTFTVQDIIQGILSILSIVQTVLGLIGAIALLVAMIGIVNTMFMSIYERTREIGVMRATGATRKAIRRLFTFEAATIGFLGGAIGVLLTFGLRYIGNIYVNNAMKSEGLGVSNIITIPLWLILAILAFTTVLGILAGIAPAFRAAKMDPVEALRYE